MDTTSLIGSGIINGARMGSASAWFPPADDQQAQGNDTLAMGPGTAGLEAQKNAAILAATQGLQMAGQGGTYGNMAPAQAGNDASAAPAGAALGITAPPAADPYDVAMLAAAGVKPDDAAPNLPMTTRVQAMLEGTPLIEIDGQRPGAAGDDAVPAAGTPQQVQALKSAQDSAMANPAFQYDGSDTHCSEGTYAVARAVGANTAPLGTGGTFYNATTQAAKLAQAAATPGTGWQQIGVGDAQNKANEGKLVVMAWGNANGHGHTVTVRPDTGNAQAASNPTVANISTQNAVIRYHGAFGGDKRPQVKVYVYDPPSP